MTNLTDTTNTAFQLASDFVNYTNLSLFLTGKAGTGKTTFLKHIKDNEVKNTVVVAPTGVAAINAGGTTIHSFFQLPFTPFIPVSRGFGTSDATNDKHSLISRLRLNNERKEIMKKLELLIIDEISMVRCDVLDAIDVVLRHVRSQHTIPFGGVQVLLIGDMHQLPPVIKNEEWQILSPYYKSEYFFNSHVIESQRPVYVELNKIYRQKDGAFVHVLNQVRNNDIDEEGYKLLQSRYLPDLHPAKEEKYITLTSHNSKADAINFTALNELKGQVYNFDATVEGDFYEKAYPADMNLKLKVGTQVMFLKNDVEKARRYFNGKIGVVDKFDEDKILVRCEGEAIAIEVRKEKWKNIQYSVDKVTNQIEEKEIGSFTQFPLRLAWAITIHKSQGLTFEKAIIDAADAFASGQVYVALSRCTSLEGIILHSMINNKSLRSDWRITEFASSQQTSDLQFKLLQEAKHVFQKEEIIKLFDFTEQVSICKSLFFLINEQNNIFNGEATLWIETLQKSLEDIQATSLKFLPQLNELLNECELPENNQPLQKRLIAAVNHFYTQFNLCIQHINSCAAVTDSKIVALDGNKLLNDLNLSIYARKHLLNACKTGFNVNNYLLQKRSFIKPFLTVNIYAGKTAFQKNDSPYPQLYKQLRTKRDEICTVKKIAVYMVANSTSLEEMAKYLPQTYDELSLISGFGKVRTHQYGEAFLSIINAFCEENNLHTNMEAMPLKAGAKKIIKKEKTDEIKVNTKTVSFLLFKEGKTIAEISIERALTVGTIENHLAHFVSIGELEINKLVSPENQKIIQTAIAKFGDEVHKTIMQNMPVGITYGQVKIVLAHINYIPSS